MIGINVGALNSSISYYDKNQVKILLSETSNRTLPSLISVTKNERMYGDAALFNIKSNLNSSLLGPHRYLNRSTEVIKNEVELGIPNQNYEFDQDNASYSTVVNNSNRVDLNDRYPATSMLSAFLTKLNNYINLTIPKSYIYTISCPDYFELHERNRYLDAIKESGISSGSSVQKEFYLLNESSAITLFYGYDRRKELKTDEPRTVCFIDMGYSKTSIIISCFTQVEFTVKSVMTERNLGCRNIDQCILEFLIKEFEEKYKTKVERTPKTLYKLREAVSQARKILTANQDTTISIDSFDNDIDMNIKLSRKLMEIIIANEVEAFRALLNKSLETFKSKNSNQYNLHSVEMVGDGVRIPIIQQVIEEVTKLKLSKTIAPDECIAKGLCLYSLTQCKEISYNYDFFLGHLSNFEVSMKLRILKDGSNNCEGLQEIKHSIVKPGSYFPTRQIFKISNLTENIDLEFYSNELPISKF